MGIMDFLSRWSNSGDAWGAILRIFLRFFQFVLAMTVAGLYGVDLNNARKAHVYADGKWVFAEVCAALAGATVLVYAIPAFKSYWGFAWDFFIFVLWTALFGIFGKIYIPAHPTPHQGGQWRMKHAVWVDLTNMLLWLLTGVMSTIIWFRSRGGRTMHTGRAKASA